MKRFICIVFISFALFSCSEKEKTKIEIDASLNITKSETGYNVYSNKGELILEFTKQNCDSLSLETLGYIYQTAKEFYNQQELEEDKPKVEGTKSI